MASPANERRISLAEAEAVVAAMLEGRVRSAAIPTVMRRKIASLGDRSMLEAAVAGDVEVVRAVVQGSFDLRRIQP